MWCSAGFEPGSHMSQPYVLNYSIATTATKVNFIAMRGSSKHKALNCRAYNNKKKQLQHIFLKQPLTFMFLQTEDAAPSVSEVRKRYPLWTKHLLQSHVAVWCILNKSNRCYWGYSQSKRVRTSDTSIPGCWIDVIMCFSLNRFVSSWRKCWCIKRWWRRLVWSIGLIHGFKTGHALPLSNYPNLFHRL